MEFDERRVYTSLNADKLKTGDRVFAAHNLYDLKKLVEKGEDIREIEEINDISHDSRFSVRKIGNPNVISHYFLAYLVCPAEQIVHFCGRDFDEKNLYTSLNADKLKAGDKVIAEDSLTGIKSELKEVIPNVKEIVHIDGENMSYRFVVRDRDGTKYSTLLAYLVEKVKSEENKSINHSDYRPFNDVQELIDTWYSKLILLSSNPSKLKYVVPTIRVQNSIGCIRNITCFDTENNCVYFNYEYPSGCPNTSYTMKELFDRFTFLDGSPCGVCAKG